MLKDACPYVGAVLCVRNLVRHYLDLSCSKPEEGQEFLKRQSLENNRDGTQLENNVPDSSVRAIGVNKLNTTNDQNCLGASMHISDQDPRHLALLPRPDLAVVEDLLRVLPSYNENHISAVNVLPVSTKSVMGVNSCQPPANFQALNETLREARFAALDYLINYEMEFLQHDLSSGVLADFLGERLDRTEVRIYLETRIRQLDALWVSHVAE